MIREFILFADILGLDYFINKKLYDRKLNDYQLLLGYRDFFVLRVPVVVDMSVTPHLFVCGLSGNGKTKMIENAIKDKHVVLINTFQGDFKNIAAPRILGNENILKYLNNLLVNIKSNKRNKPLYLVIDELLVLCIDKSITKVIMDILAVGRHYNIYLIGISQIGTKEAVKFKDLFNARVCFRQVEESSYRSVLGYSPEKKNLRKRQFYLYGTKILKGFTYTVN